MSAVTQILLQFVIRKTGTSDAKKRKAQSPAPINQYNYETQSGKRGSNPRPSAWEADVLPLNYSRFAMRKDNKSLHIREYFLQPSTFRALLPFFQRKAFNHLWIHCSAFDTCPNRGTSHASTVINHCNGTKYCSDANHCSDARHCAATKKIPLQPQSLIL